MALLHVRSSTYYADWDRRLGIPMVVMGAVIASSIFISTNDPSGILSYANGAMTLVVTALTATGRFLGLAEIGQGHTAAAHKYNAIAMTIDSALAFARTDRPDAPQVIIDATRRSMLDIQDHAPEVSPWILKDSLRHFTKSALTRIRSGVNTSNRCDSRSPLPSDSSSPVVATPGSRGAGDGTADPEPGVVRCESDSSFPNDALALCEAMRSDSDEMLSI